MQLKEWVSGVHGPKGPNLAYRFLLGNFGQDISTSHRWVSSAGKESSFLSGRVTVRIRSHTWLSLGQSTAVFLMNMNPHQCWFHVNEHRSGENRTATHTLCGVLKDSIHRLLLFLLRSDLIKRVLGRHIYKCQLYYWEEPACRVWLRYIAIMAS